MSTLSTTERTFINKEDQLQHLRDIGKLMDSEFRGPFGFRFGLDGLIGLIPVIGDFITSLFSLYIIGHAASLGCGPTTLVRMGINLLVENAIGVIPVFGNLFDFYWKANLKNIQIIESHLANPVRETIRSRVVVSFICFTILSVVLIFGYMAYLLISWIITSLMN